MNLYVGNLLYEATEEDLRKAFESIGEVQSVEIIRDRQSGKSKGFGFVEMPKSAEAQRAIYQLDGRRFMGRILRVNKTRRHSSAGV